MTDSSPSPTSGFAENARRRLSRARLRVTPGVLKALPVDALVVALERKRLRGDKRGAVDLGRTLVSTAPRSGKAHRYLVRSLLTSPRTTEDIREALHEAEIMIGLWEDPGVRILYVDVLIAQQVAGIDDPDPDAAAAVFAAVRPEARFPAFRRYLVHLQSAGHSTRSSALGLRVARSIDQAPYWTAAHEMTVRADLLDDAERIEAEFRTSQNFDPSELTSMIAGRFLRRQHFEHAQAALDSALPVRPTVYSQQYIATRSAVGDAEGVLAYLDGTQHNLTPEQELCARFDALFLLGRIDEAATELAKPDAELTDVEVFRRVRDLEREADADADVDELLDRRLHQLAADSNSFGDVHDAIARLYFELDDLDAVEALANDPTRGWQLDVLGRYAVALTHYCRRRFADAEAIIDELQGTLRHWEAGRLRSRILFESGQDLAAIEHCRANRRPTGEIDEVTYHALLQQREYPAAFGQYVSQNDRQRLIEVFGGRAEHGPSFERVACRAVVMQNGPGDEIQLAGVYDALTQQSDRLIVSCDPRLHSLLQRSLPAVEFVPSERMRSRRHPGFLSPERPPRQAGALFDLLTADAFESMQAADQVVLGRSLPLVTLSWDGPPKRILEADPELVATHALARSARPQIGVVWRSEFGSAMRSIHYLTVEQMRPILSLDVDVVVLQHDITDGERRALEHACRHDPIHVSGIDLRDDFETTAALVSGLDAVVGVGTTMVELAGALGVPAVLMHPTRFGSWRAADETGTDYWHAGTIVLGAASVTDPESCARQAADRLSTLVGTSR